MPQVCADPERRFQFSGRIVALRIPHLHWEPIVKLHSVVVVVVMVVAVNNLLMSLTDLSFYIMSSDKSECEYATCRRLLWL